MKKRGDREKWQKKEIERRKKNSPVKTEGRKKNQCQKQNHENEIMKVKKNFLWKDRKLTIIKMTVRKWSNQRKESKDVRQRSLHDLQMKERREKEKKETKISYKTAGKKSRNENMKEDKRERKKR